MKEEIVKLWNKYTEVCKQREHKYFDYVVKNYGSQMYTTNKANTPSFEGFMDFLVAESLSVQEGEDAKCNSGDPQVCVNLCCPKYYPNASQVVSPRPLEAMHTEFCAMDKDHKGKCQEVQERGYVDSKEKIEVPGKLSYPCGVDDALRLKINEILDYLRAYNTGV